MLHIFPTSFCNTTWEILTVLFYNHIFLTSCECLFSTIETFTCLIMGFCTRFCSYCFVSKWHICLSPLQNPNASDPENLGMRYSIDVGIWVCNPMESTHWKPRKCGIIHRLSAYFQTSWLCCLTMWKIRQKKNCSFPAE